MARAANNGKSTRRKIELQSGVSVVNSGYSVSTIPAPRTYETWQGWNIATAELNTVLTTTPARRAAPSGEENRNRALRQQFNGVHQRCCETMSGRQRTASLPGTELTADDTARDDFKVLPDERLGRRLSQGVEHVAEHRTHGG